MRFQCKWWRTKSTVLSLCKDTFQSLSETNERLQQANQVDTFQGYHLFRTNLVLFVTLPPRQQFCLPSLPLKDFFNGQYEQKEWLHKEKNSFNVHMGTLTFVLRQTWKISFKDWSLRNIHFHYNIVYTSKFPSGQCLHFNKYRSVCLNVTDHCEKCGVEGLSCLFVCRGMAASMSFFLPSSHGWVLPCLSSASPSASSPSASSEACKVTATPSTKTSASTYSLASSSTSWGSTWLNQRYRGNYTGEGFSFHTTDEWAHLLWLTFKHLISSSIFL